ncbi:MAG TPA: hypothetical protein VMI31_17960 [Fimbriimonadaceae bacterium]|nr:hypothetical protein [Fimbriimonadaceae bacterium]
MRILWRSIVGLLCCIGATWVVWNTACALGVVRAPLQEAVFRSPDGRRALSWVVSPGETAPRCLSFPQPGPHIFEPRIYFHGTFYSSRWTSNESVDLFVSPDFQIENSIGDVPRVILIRLAEPR